MDGCNQPGAELQGNGGKRLRLGKWGSPRRVPRTLHSRFCEDIECGDALGRLGRVQVVKACHGVDHAEEDRRLHPVVHQV